MLPCDAVHIEADASVQCMSVRLSHLCIIPKQLSISSNFILLSGSHTIVVSQCQTVSQYSDWSRSMGTSNGGEVCKIVIFDL